MEGISWNGENISRFVLGTAQLGMNYGIANVRKQPSQNLAFEIVKSALKYGVNCFDTAQAYGNSEVVLGDALRCCRVGKGIKVVSKLSPNLQATSEGAIKRSIETSCRNLGVGRLWCLMLHRADWLDLWDKGLGQILVSAREEGTVNYLGVSVYSLDDACRALANSDIQIIQVPCNLWDQRMLRGGIFEMAKEKGKLCFVRSIYLQGLLLLSSEGVAERLPIAEEASRRWHELTNEFGVKPGRLSIRFGLSLNMPLVIGVENVQQLEENNAELNKQIPLPRDIASDINNKMSSLLNDDIRNPTLWGK